MVNKEILVGLRAALSKGETLKDAMMSFYNAGYVKEEIEASALELYQGDFNGEKINFSEDKQGQLQKPTIPKIDQIQKKNQLPVIQKIEKKKVEEKFLEDSKTEKKQEFEEQPQKIEKRPVNNTPKVSDYSEKPVKCKNGLLMILLYVVIFLLGVSIVVCFFKDKIIDFIS